MKRITVLFVLLCASLWTFAQTQVATLQHGEEMSAYYGMNALVEAHAAAVEGDIITLSSGTFTRTNIKKAITLHGAGCAYDTLGIAPTIVVGDFYVSVLSSEYLIIEGVCFDGDITYEYALKYAKFIKCFFNNIKPKTQNTTYNNTEGRMTEDVHFINCMFNGTAYIREEAKPCVSFINCIVNGLRNYNSLFINIYNSYIKNFTNNSGNFNLYNCIVGKSSENLQIIDSYAYNCIEIDTVFSSSVQTFNCMTVNSYSEVFESFDGSISSNSNFHLNNEVATSFHGSDGSEVGIYGGAMPYSTRPSYLILNRCNVANKSTIDGKLSVDIEVISNGGN